MGFCGDSAAEPSVDFDLAAGVAAIAAAEAALAAGDAIGSAAAGLIDVEISAANFPRAATVVAAGRRR